jgi:hypothetical protein
MCACCCETIASALVLLRVWQWMQWQYVALHHAAQHGTMLRCGAVKPRVHSVELPMGLESAHRDECV